MDKFMTTVARKRLLLDMNDYVLSVIGDEVIYETWFSLGVPDGATDDDFQSIAEDDELWRDVVKVFKCCVSAEVRGF